MLSYERGNPVNGETLRQRQSVGFRIQASDFGMSLVLVCCEQIFGFRVVGFGFWVSGFGLRVPGFRFRVSDFGFRV